MKSRFQNSRCFTLCVTLCLLSSLIAATPAFSQGGNLGGFGTLGGVEPTGRYPSQQYYLALDIYRSGDLVEAINAFDAALGSSQKDIRGRWIDAIPVLAMLAECNWHLGNLPAAREHADHAIQIAITNRGWLGRVDWQGVVRQGALMSQPSGLWGEAAAVRRVPISDQVTYRSGQPLTESVLRRGGEIQELTLRTMDIVEILRGLALASYRRRVLLGPLAEQDALASALLDATKYPADLQAQMGRTLIGSLRATGHFTLHDDNRTIEEASRHMLAGGAAHPLSALTMLSQISAMAGTENFQGVTPQALNLVHVAAALDQPEFIGEALQLAAGCASPQQAALVRQGASTVAGAMLRKSPMAALHALVAGADASITAGDFESAAVMLNQAQTLGSRRDVTMPRINAYGSYVAARLAAARGASIGVSEATPVDQALNQLAGFALNHRVRSRSLVSMPRLYQLGLVRQAAGTQLGGNTSERLLKIYCDDPTIDVWRRDAVDALASLLVDRSAAHLARIQLAASGGYAEQLLLVSDRMLGARFQQRLPLGGRIAQVRALAGFDDGVLDKRVLDARNQMGREMAELRAASVAAAGGDPVAVEVLESKACVLALSRLELPSVVPPMLDQQVPAAKLPARTAMLTFTDAGSHLFATWTADGKVSMWTVNEGNRLPGEVGRLLKEIGVGKTRGNRIPENDAWREAAASVRRRLVPDDTLLSADRMDELIVVPDGPLWYLPFEILPVGEEDSELLGDRIAIRYAPTPGLALNPVAPPPAIRTIGLYADLFFAPREPEQNEAIVQSIVDVMDNPIRLPQELKTPSGLIGDKLGHLVVASPQNSNSKNPLLFRLADYDVPSPFGTLAGWIRFPVQGPRSVVLMGMRTPVDLGQMGSGDELFTTLCALHCSGVRSVLVSRWAVGGESSAIALRELVQELPFTGINAAWHRAREVLRRSELNPAGEPLLMKAEHDIQGLSGDQPLFWSGYLVSSPNLPSGQP